MFSFQYRGGVGNNNPTSYPLIPGFSRHPFYGKPAVAQAGTEKFLLFLIAGGREIPFYQAERDGMIQRDSAVSYGYTTALQYGKLFLYERGIGIATRMQSFFFRFRDTGSVVTVRGFWDVDQPTIETMSKFFVSKISFLKKEEVYKILDKGSTSLQYLQSQGTPAVAFLKRLITVEKPELKNVRQVRIGIRRKGFEDVD